MKNSYYIIICAFLLIGQRVWGESVTQKIHFSYAELKCDTISGKDDQVYSILTYPGTDNDYYNLGFPSLPVKYITIALPYTADDILLNIQSSNTTSHFIGNRIFPIQEQEATSIEERDYKFM